MAQKTLDEVTPTLHWKRLTTYSSIRWVCGEREKVLQQFTRFLFCTGVITLKEEWVPVVLTFLKLDSIFI